MQNDSIGVKSDITPQKGENNMKPPSYIYQVVILEDVLEKGKICEVTENMVLEATGIEQVVSHCKKQPGFKKIIELEEIGYKVVNITSQD